MLLPGSLGFPSILLVFVLSIGLVICQKWRNAVARKEEITRLLIMVSEEAELVELDAAVEYSSMPVVKRYQCAVCYCPTTTRCSQCKAVRYCSGKCQLIHWRQGHKDECCSPVTTMYSDENDDFGEKSASQNQFEMYDNDSHIEGKFSHSSEAPSVMDADEKVKPSVDFERKHTCSASFSTSSTCFSSSATRNESVDASTSEMFGLSIPDRSEGHPSDIIARRITGPITNANDAELLPTSSSSESTVGSVNRMSWTSELNKTISGYSNEKFQSRLKISKSRTVISDNVQPTILESRTIDGAALSEGLVKDVPKPRSLPSSSCSRSYFTSHDRVNDSQPFRGKEVRSVSVSSSSDHPLAATGRCSVSSEESAKCSSVHMPSKIGSIQNLSQNARKGLRTSVQKVVQQFRASKQSKPHLLGVGKDIAAKYNYKTVFPYELFVQLFSCDMVELCPFGLLNCGNSCYANVVLQCLTFTRPLASYLLQGLHSKTCQKEWCFICEFEHLILKGKEWKFPLSPIGMLSQIQKIGSHLGPGREEDAHEFLRWQVVVDTMQLVCLEEAGVVDPLAEESTLVGLTFGGYLRSKIKCMKCLGKSERFERIMDLTVEIDGDIDTLEEALSQFTATEILDGENKYRCSRCRSYEKAKKTLTIMEAPNILTIVLKPFQSGNFEKLNKLVCFPEVLNMAPYMSEMSDKYPTYSLYAVVVHLDIMNAALSGHYVCYVKNFQGEWFKIDDSMVIPVDLGSVLLERAYMLLFARHTPQAPSLSRNTGVLSDGKIKRNLEAVPSCCSRKKTTSKAKSNSLDSSMLQPRLENYPYWMTLGGRTSNQFLDPEDWRFHLMQRVPTVDLSGDSSSIFSCSDAVSCSTESSGGSTSAEDITGYIFGEVAPTWYRPCDSSH